MANNLYSGEVSIKLSKSHRYTVVDNGEVIKPEGVTSILGKVVAKDGLIGWASKLAATAMYDSFNETLAMHGEVTEPDMKQALNEAKDAHTRKKDAGADVGSMVHNACEAYIKDVLVNGRGGDVPDLPDDQASKAFDAFLEWDTKNQPKYLFSEEIVYSRSMRYGGCADVAFEMNGKRYLGDFKTGDPKRQWIQKLHRYGSYMAYPEHWLQVAAYDVAYGEGLGYTDKGYTEDHVNFDTTKKAFDAYMILYITKSGKLYTYENPISTDTLKLGFRHAVNLSRLLKKLS